MIKDKSVRTKKNKTVESYDPAINGNTTSAGSTNDPSGVSEVYLTKENMVDIFASTDPTILISSKLGTYKMDVGRESVKNFNSILPKDFLSKTQIKNSSFNNLKWKTRSCFFEVPKEIKVATSQEKGQNPMIFEHCSIYQY